MKRKNKRSERLVALLVIIILLTSYLSYFMIAPIVEANGLSPCDSTEKGLKDPVGCANQVIGPAKDTLGAENKEVVKLKESLDKIDTLAKEKGAEQDANKQKEIQKKIDEEKKKIEEQIEKVNKEEIKKEEELKKKEKRLFQDWVDTLFSALSFIRAGYLASIILASHGGAGSCSPEQPLKGVDPKICLKCNEDPFRICTRERCAILGNCIAVPTAKADQYVCVPGKCEETGLPVFDKVNVSWFVDGEMNGSTDMLTMSGDRTINIKLDDYNEPKGKPLPFNTKTILINLTTYEKSGQCRYIVDKKGANFSEMIDFENNYFPTLPNGTPGWQYAYVLLPGDLSRNATHRIFIKCKNICGVEPEASYDQNIITFTLDKKPDQLPPNIVYVDPASNSMIRGDLAFVNASFWLDEKGNCKFSDKSNNYTINYTSMQPFGSYSHENSSVIDGGCYLGKCLDRNEQCSRCWLLLNTSRGYDLINYTGTEFNETKLFHLLVRCNDLQGNVMTEDSILDYVLMTAPPYNISIIKPEQDNRTYDRQPDIEVTSDPRMTECRYRIFQQNRLPGDVPKLQGMVNCKALNWSSMWPIDTGMSTLHKGKHNETLNGSASGLAHTICVKCRDTWQIEETAKADFYVLLDSVEPIIVRMYHDTTAGDYLIIETNEASECVYGTSDTIKCNYNFSDGTAMMTTDNYLHAAYWSLDHLYYVKCKDRWDNYPGQRSNANQCTMVIDPYEVP